MKYRRLAAAARYDERTVFIAFIPDVIESPALNAVVALPVVLGLSLRTRFKFRGRHIWLLYTCGLPLANVGP